MDYNVIQPDYEIRAAARQQLSGRWGQMVFIFFIYGLIFLPYYFCSTVTNKSVTDYIFVPKYISDLNTILSILVFVVSGPFALGFAGLFIKRVRGGEVQLSDMFDGFKRFFPAFLLFLLVYIFTFLWTLLLIVPGIIKSISYSMGYYILNDNPGMSPLEAIKRSQIMMKGHKGQYFLLVLSFFGWALLAGLTLFIGCLWLSPYMNLSFANFYENLKKNQEKAAGAPTEEPAVNQAQ